LAQESSYLRPSRAMAVAPRPKTKVSRTVGLQKGQAPRTESLVRDPNATISASKYRRAVVSDSAGAMPAETYQYDLVYRKFREDETFWRQWKVVDCARQSSQSSISQEHASIRVVLDLPSNVKLYPTAYTPGFPTMPHGTDVHYEAPQFKPVPGLPAGYSVALDVYILEDARILLEHQRNYRNGEISSDLEWLDEIIAQHDEKNGRPRLRDKSSSGSQLTLSNYSVQELAQEEIAMKFARADDARKAEMLKDPAVNRALQDLDTLPYSDLYSTNKTHPHIKTGPSEVWKECAFVKPFEGGDAAERWNQSSSWL